MSQRPSKGGAPALTAAIRSSTCPEGCGDCFWKNMRKNVAEDFARPAIKDLLTMWINDWLTRFRTGSRCHGRPDAISDG